MTRAHHVHIFTGHPPGFSEKSLIPTQPRKGKHIAQDIGTHPAASISYPAYRVPYRTNSPTPHTNANPSFREQRTDHRKLSLKTQFQPQPLPYHPCATSSSPLCSSLLTPPVHTYRSTTNANDTPPPNGNPLPKHLPSPQSRRRNLLPLSPSPFPLPRLKTNKQPRLHQSPAQYATSIPRKS